MKIEKPKTLNIQEHLKNADDFAIAQHHLERIWVRLNQHFPKKSAVMVHIDKAVTSPARIRNILDDHWQGLITKEERNEHGYIYFVLHERYKKFHDHFKEAAEASKSQPIRNRITRNQE